MTRWGWGLVCGLLAGALIAFVLHQSAVPSDRSLSAAPVPPAVPPVDSPTVTPPPATPDAVEPVPDTTTQAPEDAPAPRRDSQEGVDVAGIVLDHTGEPVAGAEIHGSRLTGGGDVTKSDTSGQFRLTGFADGDEVTVRAKKTSIGRSDPAEFRAPAEAIRIHLKEPATVSGWVLDDNGDPVAGAELAWSSHGQAQPQEAMGLHAETQSDASGAFELTGIIFPEGAVLARADGFAAAVRPVTATMGARIENIDVRLSRGQSVAGTVTDSGGSPISGARIGLYTLQLGGNAQIDRPVATDEQGRYALDGLGAGAYRLAADARGYGRQVQDITVPGDASLTVDWTLATGGVIEGRLLRGDAPAAGWVQLTNFKPDRQPTLIVEISRSLDDPVQPGLILRESATGHFVFEGLPEGAYYLVAMASDATPDEADVRRDADGVITWLQNQTGAMAAATVALTPGARESVDLYFDGGATIEGAVHCGGQPIEGATVTVTLHNDGQRMRHETITGQDGRYSVEGLVPGHACVSIKVHTACTVMRGYSQWPCALQRDIALTANGSAVMDFDLQAMGGLVLELTNEAGASAQAVALQPGHDIAGGIPRPGEPGFAAAGAREYGPEYPAFGHLDPGVYQFVLCTRRGELIDGPIQGEVRAGEMTRLAWPN